MANRPEIHFVVAEDFFTGVIIKRRRRWQAVVLGCPCCVPIENLGCYETRAAGQRATAAR